MFEHLMKQNLKLIKNGYIIADNIKASVQDKIYINDIKLPIEAGDSFQYILPSGQIQNLIVKKITLYNMGSPLDHYEIEYN